MLATMNFFSTVLGMNSSMHVILPDRYDHAGNPSGRKDPYPVLYLFHGGGDNHTKWLRFTSVERYAEEKKIAVVMPSTLQGWYTDMKEGYNFFTFLNEELPKIVHENFPKISSKPGDTFAAGLSMGGMGALKWAFVNPGRLSAVASLSSSIDMKRSMERAMKANNGVLPERMKHLWGSPEEIDGTVDDIPWLIDRALESGKSLPKVYIACGKEDFTYDCNTWFFEAYRDRLDITADLDGHGTHEWGFWDRQIKAVLDWLPVTE